MRRPEYGRNPHKRTAYVDQPALLLVGVAHSDATPSACLGTPTTRSCRQLEVPHTREGFGRFEPTRQAHLDNHGRPHLLSARAPSGRSGQARYERLTSSGSAVCLGPGHAGRTNRTTRQDGTRKTDAKDAARSFDFRRQGTCLLPGARALARTAAYRLRRRPMALKNRGSPLRNPLRAAMDLAGPELQPLLPALTPPMRAQPWCQLALTLWPNRTCGARRCLGDWRRVGTASGLGSGRASAHPRPQLFSPPAAMSTRTRMANNASHGPVATSGASNAAPGSVNSRSSPMWGMGPPILALSLRAAARRPCPTWQNRFSVEHRTVRLHGSSPSWCSVRQWYWLLRCTASIPRGVSQQKMLAFFTEH
jgi:hypothetical protein